MKFFRSAYGAGPPVTAEMIASAERTLGRLLPVAYRKVLEEQNGGVPARPCFPTLNARGWADGHLEVAVIHGVGYDTGIDGAYGSAYMITEWGYPDVGILIALTPSGGHECIMLDYTRNSVEPAVVYVGDDRVLHEVAGTFAEFANGLVDRSLFAF